MSRYGGGGDSRYGGGSHYGGGNDHYGGGGGHRGGPQQNGGGGGGGAEHLARIHGTEEDRVNCPFYFKIGACRHGDRCSRVHNKPVFSQTIIVPHMYQNPLSQIIAQNGDPSQLDMAKVDEEFEDFYEEVFEELCSFGHLEELNICDNLGDHLVGNVYVKYEDEEDAAKAQQTLAGRFYAGRPLHCEFSPVTDFREARCRQFDEGTCNRGGYCNFMHIKTVQRSLQRELERKFNTSHKGGSRSRSRSRSPRSRSRSRSPRKSSRHRSSHRSSRRDRSRSRDKDHRSSRRSRRHERPEGSSSSRKSDGEQRGSYDQPRHDNGDSQPAAPAPPSNN